MVINIELNNKLQIVIMGFVFIVTSILFLIRKKKLDNSFISIIIYSLSGGITFYAGFLWILKPFDIIIDTSIFDAPQYNVMTGILLIYFTFISLKELIEKQKQYMFNWDKIPGNDNGKLIKFLKHNLHIDWIKTAKIEKIDDGKTIRVYTEIKSLSLRLNDERSKVNLRIEDGRTYEFLAEAEKDSLNIYRK